MKKVFVYAKFLGNGITQIVVDNNNKECLGADEYDVVDNKVEVVIKVHNKPIAKIIIPKEVLL